MNLFNNYFFKKWSSEDMHMHQKISVSQGRWEKQLGKKHIRDYNTLLARMNPALYTPEYKKSSYSFLPLN